MAKLFIPTDRMKKDFDYLKDDEKTFDQEALNFMASELCYFADYAEKNKIKTIYDLEEKLGLPFEAFLDAFEEDVYDSEGLDYKVALDCYKKLLTTFRDPFLFEADTICAITRLYFRLGEADTAEAFMKGYLEEDKTCAKGYMELVLGFSGLDDKKAEEYLGIAKSLELDNPDLIENLEL